MAIGKKSFILYTDLILKIEHLTTDEKGQLFEHLLAYVNDLNPVLENRVLIGVWKPIELQLKRDLKKFEDTKKERSVSGQLGNLKRYYPDLYINVKSDKITIERALAIAKNRKNSHSDTNLAVNDNVNVNVSTKVDKVKPTPSEIEILKPYEIFKKNIKNGNYQISVEGWIRKLNGNKDKLNQLLLKDFKEQLVTDTKIHKTAEQVKSHFGNWLNVYISKQR